MREIVVAQGSHEWATARLGIPTASRFDSILTAKTRKPSSSSEKYMSELIAERLLGHSVTDVSSAFMARGSELEKRAVAAYEFEHDCETREAGLFLSDDDAYGASPDRLVGEDGLLEIKCPSAIVHVMALRGLQDEAHTSQCQGQMLVTGRKWVDLVFYNPSLPRAEVRIERDESYIMDLRGALLSFCDRLDSEAERIFAMMAESRREGDTERTDAPANGVNAGTML